MSKGGDLHMIYSGNQRLQISAKFDKSNMQVCFNCTVFIFKNTIWQSKSVRFKIKSPTSHSFLKTRRLGHMGFIFPSWQRSSGFLTGVMPHPFHCVLPF